jgi:hypothetical protein
VASPGRAGNPWFRLTIAADTQFWQRSAHVKKRVQVIVATSILCVTCFIASGAALADGFQLPDLIPFAKKKPVDRTARFERKRESSGGLFSWLPKLEMPTLGGSSSRQANKPSTFSRMTSSPPTFWEKTKSTLMPWTADDTSKTSQSNLGSRTRKKKQPAKTSLFPWFNETPKEPEIESVNDFLSLPQPKF